MTAIGASWGEAIQGGGEAVRAMFTPFDRAERLRWGATEAELEASYAGDELIPHPVWGATHAITIDAAPERIWPWIAQIGQGRGGFYSYQKLENLAGSGIENTDHVLEEHQGISEGDRVRLHAQVPPLTAVIVDEPTTLVLFGDPAGPDSGVTVSSSWAFLLLRQARGTTRFLSRTRYDCADDRRSRLMGGPWLLEPISFVMERKMLMTVKALVESPR